MSILMREGPELIRCGGLGANFGCLGANFGCLGANFGGLGAILDASSKSKQPFYFLNIRYNKPF